MAGGISSRRVDIGLGQQNVYGGVVARPGLNRPVAAPKQPPPPQAQPRPKPQAPQQQSQPVAPTGAYGGGDDGSAPTKFNPLQMLQQMDSGNPPPAPVSGSSSPVEASMIPSPTIFDLGNPVAANPNLGRRNPAIEGLIESFRRRSIY